MRKTLSTKTIFSLLLVLILLFTIITQSGSVAYAAKKAKISKTKATLYVKNTLKLKVKGAKKKVTWSSSNKKVVKVSSKGIVTAVKKGTAKIIAKTGKQKLTCKVTVMNPTISDREAEINLPETKLLKVSHAVGKVKWSSSDTSVATVSSKGLVRGVHIGEATITALASGVKLKCNITVGCDIGTYYYVWNVNADLSPEGGDKLTEAQAAEVRCALNSLIDRTYIVESIIQENKTPAPSYIAKGFKEPDGSEFYQHSGPEGTGYYPLTADREKVIETLKKYYRYEIVSGQTVFKDFPFIKYICNVGNPVHLQVGSYIQSELKSVGISMSVYGYEWDEYVNELKAGNYTLARGGWIIEEYDAIDMLQVFLTESGNNDTRLGTGNNLSAIYEVDLSGIGDGKYSKISGNWNGTYDLLVGTYINEETDPLIRSQLMHKAEDLLMSTGCVSPIHYYRE